MTPPPSPGPLAATAAQPESLLPASGGGTVLPGMAVPAAATTSTAPTAESATLSGTAPVPGAAPEPRRPPLRVVRPGELSPARRRRRARLVVVGAGLLVSAGLFGLVAFHVLLTQGQFRLDRLDAHVADAQAANERLRLQVAQLSSPSRIVAAAQERLGMVPPPSVKYLAPTALSSLPPVTAPPPPAPATHRSTAPAGSHTASAPASPSHTSPTQAGPAAQAGPAVKGTGTSQARGATVTTAAPTMARP